MKMAILEECGTEMGHNQVGVQFFANLWKTKFDNFQKISQCAELVQILCTHW